MNSTMLCRPYSFKDDEHGFLVVSRAVGVEVYHGHALSPSVYYLILYKFYFLLLFFVSLLLMICIYYLLIE
jgi:hypothetical protein